MIQTCSLSSSSKGNSYFIETNDGSFLVDAGISCKQITLRLELMNKSPRQLKGIFITHEHSDHIKGLRVLSKTYNIPVYMTRGTYENSKTFLKPHLLNFIHSNDIIKFNNTTIKSFSKSHDAAEPCSFSFVHNNKQITIATDLGYACSNIKSNVTSSDILYLESNYDEEMLKNGPYPYSLKKRVSGKKGHLSNYNTGTLILEHATPKLKHIILSHISENNNTPEIALKTFNSLVCERKDLNFKTHIATFYKPTKIIKL